MFEKKNYCESYLYNSLQCFKRLGLHEISNFSMFTDFLEKIPSVDIEMQIQFFSSFANC